MTPFSARGRVPHQTVSGTAPAGALITTPADLARFGLAMLHGGELDGARVLAPESVAEMMRLQARAHPRMPEGFGLGFGVREEPGRKFVWWDGSLAGAASRLALLPEHGVGVAILSNLADNAPVSAAARRILELLVPSPPPAPAVTPDPAGEAARVGAYRLRDVVDPSMRIIEWLANLRVERDDGGLTVATLLDKEPARLIPLGDGVYLLAGRGLFDGSHVVFDGDRLFAGFVEAERIPAWQSARALFAYAGVAALALLGAIAGFAVRWLRRRRARAL